MAVVTRNAIWLNSGDYPYIDIKVKDVQTFIQFSERLDFYTPCTEHFVWPGNAADDGIDIHTHQYEWWLVLDGKNVIGCRNAQIHGILFEIFNTATDCRTQMNVTESEAIEIKQSILQMINSLNIFQEGDSGLLKPPHTVSTYPVSSLCYIRDPTPLPASSEHGVLFTSTN